MNCLGEGVKQRLIKLGTYSKILGSDKARFLLTSLALNFAGFAFWFILVAYGLNPITTFTIVYLTSVVTIFFINKSYVFRHQGNFLNAFKLHILVYCFGYVLSFSILTFLLDQVRLNYIFSMLLTYIIMPLYFYSMQKYLVFR